MGLVFVPQWWVKYIFKLYDEPSPRFPGNGAELARHLLSLLSLETVKVKDTPLGDHFNPDDQSLNLSPAYFNGKSLTTMVIVAHEIGHVIQQKEDNPWFRLRYRLATLSGKFERLGSIAILLIPITTLVLRVPTPAILLFLIGFFGMFSSVLVHLITFPLEFDASFNKALPLLLKGEFIQKEDEFAARRILKAAALTYVAAALSNLLNIGRWITVLRR